jgi:hypothetical protein
MAQAAVDWFGAEWGGNSRTREGVARDDLAWRGAHEALLRLAEKRAGLDFEEGRCLLTALRVGAHLRLGYGSFQEYAERLFGYGSRVTQEKLRVAEALEELPETARELETGRVSFSAVRELTRVATAQTEGDWLEAARGRTVREIEQLVSGREPGSLPGDAPDASAKRHVLRLEVSGEVLATFREAMAKVRRDARGALDDDAAVLLLARSVLGGPKDDGRSSYQVALTICECCGKGRQQGRGELVEVAREVVEMAICNGQNIGDLLPNAHVGSESESPSDAHVGSGTESPCDDHVGSGTESPCDDHVGSRLPARSNAAFPLPHSARATQTIPPALRRAVLRRDEARCKVPGCRHATFVDVHHLVPRAEGGRHSAENLVTLCGAHHRAIHRGELIIEGTPSTGLRFLHADGTVYGGSPSPVTTNLRAKASRALELMGYRPSEVKRALLRIHGNSDANLEQLIRQALRELAANKPAQPNGSGGGAVVTGV